MIGILCGREVEVRPVSEWRKSAMNALQSADLETWADRCLTDEGYDVWEQLDPTFGEIAEFFASFSDEMAAATDVQFPGGPKPSRSQRRTAGRR